VLPRISQVDIHALGCEELTFQLLITGSVIAFGSTITPLQVFGYSISLSGLIMFKTTGGK
jgi:hypothetical protein